MKRKSSYTSLYILLILLLSGFCTQVQAQVDNEFWAVVPEINNVHHSASPHVSRKGAPVIFRFTTFDLPSTVKMFLPADPTFDTLVFDIPANTTYSYQFWRADATLSSHDNYCNAVNPNTSPDYANARVECKKSQNWCTDLDKLENIIVPNNISNKGVLIKSTSQITCYLEIGAFYNREIISLKGRNAKGYEFNVPFQTQFKNHNSGDYSKVDIYSAIQILATEDNTSIEVTPTKKVWVYGTGIINAGQKITRTLNKGQIFMVVPSDVSNARHIGQGPEFRLEGSFVKSDKPIVVESTDDLILYRAPSGGGSVDFVADQLVPNSLLGSQYVVIRGRSSNAGVDGAETAYILATEDNTKIYVNGVYKKTLTAGEQYPYQLENNPFIYINSQSKEKRFSVFHVSGMGYQLGGALIPPIDDYRCTGSFQTVINRSDVDPFKMIVLVRKGAEGDFLVNGSSTIIQASDFSPVPNADWSAAFISYNAPINKPLLVKNKTNMFHIGILMGDADCFYGYFSDYNTNRGKANSTKTETTMDADHCLGDSVVLMATGGSSFLWSCYPNSGTVLNNSSINNIHTPTPVIYPHAGMHRYDVTIDRACFDDTTMTVYVTIDSIKSDFDIVTPTKCSPVDAILFNTSGGSGEEGNYRYYWEYSDGVTSSEKMPPARKFVNQTLKTDTIIVGLTVQSNCSDYHQDTIIVFPEIKAKIGKGDPKGCAQSITQKFAVDTLLSGPFIDAVWSWGDGTGNVSVKRKFSADSISHTFWNNTEKDTIYKVILTLYYIDSVCPSSTTYDVFVPGLAQARFSISNAKGCSPLNVDITNNTYGDVTYEWWINNTGDFTGPADRTDNFSTITQPFVNTSNTPQEQFVKLRITKLNDDGTKCFDEYGPDTILVYPQMTTQINPVGPLSGCQPLEQVFTQKTIPDIANNYYWDFGDGTSSGEANPALKIYENKTNQDQKYKVKLRVTNKYGCEAVSPPVSVRVFSYIDANFSVLPDTIGCSPFTVEITDNTSLNANVKASVWTEDGVLFNPTDKTFIKEYTNATNANIEHVINLTNTNGHTECDVHYSKTLVVRPEVVAKFANDKNFVCSNEEISFTNQSYYKGNSQAIQGATAEYYWDFGDGVTSIEENPKHAFINAGNGTDAAEFIVSLTINVDGCKSTFTKTLSIYPSVVAQFTSDKYIICSPEDMEIKNQSVGGLSYKWEFTDGTPPIETTDLSSITHTFINDALNDVKEVDVKLTASNNMCTDEILKKYTIYPKLIPSFNIDDAAGCAPHKVVFSNQSSGGKMSDLSVKWDFGDGETDNLTTQNVEHTYSNKSNADITRDVTLIITNKAGCSNSITKQVEVWPEVKADFTYLKESECSPMVVKIENTSLNGGIFEWDYGFDGKTQTTTSKEPLKPTFYHTNANKNAKDVYTITLKATDKNHSVCSSTVSKKITIYPPVVADFDIVDNNIGCSPLDSKFENKSTGYKLNYIWKYGDGNLSSETKDLHEHTYRNYTANNKKFKAQLIATDSLGCMATTNREVVVYREVVADFTFLKDGQCTPYPVIFSYPKTALNGDHFKWDFGDGNTVEYSDKSSFKYTYDNTEDDKVKTYNITLEASDMQTGCSSTKTKTIDVYPRLKPKFEADNNKGCEPLTVNFVNKSKGLAKYKWDYGDGQYDLLDNPTHTFSHLEKTDQTYKVKLVAMQEHTGCEKEFESDILVYSHVRASFGLSKPNAKKNAKKSASKGDAIVGGCNPFSISLVDSSQTDGTWAWDFGDGETGTMQQPGVRVYHNNDVTLPLENEVYNIKLVVTNVHGCSKEHSSKLEVYPRSTPDFDVPTEGCHPFNVKFKDKSIVDKGTKYYWTLGDGSSKVESDFSYTFSNFSYKDPVIFTTTLRTTTSYGCIDSISKKIRVNPKPLADFMPSIDRHCPPFEASLSNHSIGKNLKYMWDFDNGNTANRDELTVETPLYDNLTTGDDVKQYNPTLIAETEYGCTDTLSVPIFVYPRAVADFSMDKYKACSPLITQFDNKSNAAAKFYKWDFGDGNTSGLKAPNHVFHNDSTDDQKHIVRLYVESNYGCKDTTQDTVWVYLQPQVDFDMTDPVQVFPNDSILYTNLTNEGPWEYLWDFGNNDSSTTKDKKFYYAYGTWGPKENDFAFNVKLSAKSKHCSGEIEHKVRILAPKPEVTIDKVTPGDGCVPLTVTFNVHQKYSDTFEWDFGDGGTSTVPEPIYTYQEAGVYNAKLTVTGAGGSWFAYTVVTVYPLPTVNFKISPDFVMLPNQQIQTFNLTTDAVSYLWRFGDGGTSDLESPNYLYKEPGEFDITLIATSANGCVDSLVQYQAVTVSGAGSIEYPNAFMPNQDSPEDGSYDIPDKENIVFHPVYYAVRKYDLWIFNRWGEQIFHSDDVNVGWNGRYNNNGRKLEQDVYFWKAKGEYENGQSFKKAGDVMLIIK